jgi:protein SCO1/2
MFQVSCTASEREIAEWIDNIRHTNLDGLLLVNILSRNHPIYNERCTSKVNRIRGYVMASFETIGLPQQALAIVCEELDNGHSPYLIAAAAMALRGFKYPTTQLTHFLLKAFLRVSHADEAISFVEYNPTWPLTTYTTATREILKTLSWLGSNANEALPVLNDYVNGIPVAINKENKELIFKTIKEIKNSCKEIKTSDCCSFKSPVNKRSKVSSKEIAAILLQDQDGNKSRFGDYFNGSVSIVSFFYTRCDNPNKCSATLTKLAQIQTKLVEDRIEDIKLAAITYDSAYDTPERLKAYATNRGLQHNDKYKTLRVLNNEEDRLQKYFSSKVNYNSSIVNHHSIELFILNNQGIIISEFSGIELNIKNIIFEIKKVKRTQSSLWNKIMSITTNSILPFVMLLFPKCPLCWAGYLSVFGLSSISWLKYSPNFFWLLVLFAIVNLIIMYHQSNKNPFYSPILIACTGYIILVFSFLLNAHELIKFSAIGLIVFSSLMNIFNLRYLRQVRINEST